MWPTKPPTGTARSAMQSPQFLEALRDGHRVPDREARIPQSREARALEAQADALLAQSGCRPDGQRRKARSRQASHDVGPIGRIRSRVADSQAARKARQDALAAQWDAENKARLAARQEREAFARVIGGARLER